MPTLRRSPRSRRRSQRTQLFLLIEGTLYFVRALPCDAGIAAKAFRLSKPDGTLYDVAQTRFGHQCDCPDFIFRRDGIDPDGCKHVRALVSQGLLDRPATRGRAGFVDLTVGVS